MARLTRSSLGPMVAVMLLAAIASCNDSYGPTPPPPTPGPSQSPPAPSPAPPSTPVSYRFSGVIRDSLDEQPIAGVRVTIASDDRSIETFVWTDSRGGYEISASATGASMPVTVSTRQEGYAPQDARRVVSAGSVTTDFTLVPDSFTLQGKVQDNDNRDAPFCDPIKVEVVSGPSAGRVIQVARPGDGSYQFAGLQPGMLTIRASSPGYYIRETRTRLRGLAPFNRLDFILPRGPRPADGTRVNCNLPPLQ
jgi:hypothetical protein